MVGFVTVAKMTKLAAPSAPRESSPTQRPLMSVCGVVSFTGLKRDTVFRMVEEGKFLYAWNFGSPRSSPELRILPRCVVDVAANRTCELTDEQAYALILPQGKQLVTSVDLTHQLNICAEVVRKWIHARQFTIVRKARRGPGGGASIRADSVRKFLETRRF